MSGVMFKEIETIKKNSTSESKTVSLGKRLRTKMF